MSIDNTEDKTQERADANAGVWEYGITPEELAHILALKEDVRRRVYAAFADTQYPGDEALGEMGFISDHIYAFAGKTWQEIPPDSLETESDYYAANFMGDAGFRYFIPVFILGCLGENSSRSLEQIAPEFIAPYCKDISKVRDYEWLRFKNRFADLTTDQYQCVALYMEYCYADMPYFDDATPECVLSYWRNPYFSLNDSHHVEVP